MKTLSLPLMSLQRSRFFPSSVRISQPNEQGSTVIWVLTLFAVSSSKRCQLQFDQELQRQNPYDLICRLIPGQPLCNSTMTICSL